MECKLIKKFLPELCIFSSGLIDYIKASDLEAELAKGVEVFGCDGFKDYSSVKMPDDNHLGLLIGYQPIESSKPVSREELKTYLMGYEIGLPSKAHEILKRILENGVK